MIIFVVQGQCETISVCKKNKKQKTKHNQSVLSHEFAEAFKMN